MGYGSEMREEMEIEHELAVILYCGKSYEMLDSRMWQTKDGRKISFDDMEETHIMNCIRMLEKQMDSGDLVDEVWDLKRAWVKAFKSELDARAKRVFI